MNTRNTLLSLAAAGVLASSAAMAVGPNDHQRGDRNHGRHMERMLDHVDASDAQRAQIAAIQAETKPQRNAIREQMQTARRSLRAADPADASYQIVVNEQATMIGQLTAQQVQLRATTRARVHTVLTEDQLAELASAREERRERRSDMREQRRDRRS